MMCQLVWSYTKSNFRLALYMSSSQHLHIVWSSSVGKTFTFQSRRSGLEPCSLQYISILPQKLWDKGGGGVMFSTQDSILLHKTNQYTALNTLVKDPIRLICKGETTLRTIQQDTREKSITWRLGRREKKKHPITGFLKVEIALFFPAFHFRHW